MADAQHQASYQHEVPAADQANPYGNNGPVLSGGGNDIRSNEATYRGDSSVPDGADWRATARNRSGFPIPTNKLHELDPSHVIVKWQGMWDTLAAHKIAGLRVDDAQPSPQTQQKTEQQQDQKQEQEEARPPIPRDATALWEATEQTVAPLLEQGGTAAYAAVEAVISGSEKTLDATVKELAQTMGVESEQIRETVQTAFAQYVETARLAVGMSPEEWQLFAEFASQPANRNAQHDAAQRMFHEGDLNPLRKLVAKYQEQGTGGRVSDDLVYRACVKQGVSVTRDPGNGHTQIKIGGEWMNWRVALQRGLIEF